MKSAVGAHAVTAHAIVAGAARAGTWRGVLWTVLIAANYFLISSPLAFEPVFEVSLHRAAVCTAVVCVLSIPWLRLPRVPLSLLAFLAFAFASSYWSIDQDATIRFLGLYVVVAVLGVVVACNVETRVLTHGVLLGGVVVMATSLYAFWADLPGAGVLPGSSGFIAGVGTNRNILAYTMIIAFAFAVSFVPQRRALRILWAMAIATCVSGIVLAESATGIVALGVLSTTALVMGIDDHLVAAGRPPGRRYWTTISGLILAVVVISVGWYEALHRSLQRDLSLTGRVQIWEAAWSASSTRVRTIGDGWGSVWPHPWLVTGPNGAFDDIVQLIGHPVTHGHNSVFDLLPELGLVGVGLFALIYGQSLFNAVRLHSGDASPAHRETGRATILGIVGLVLAGVTEPISTVPLGFFVAVLLVAHVPRRRPSLKSAPSPGTEPDAATES